MKKAFTLFELIIVVILISIIYYFTLQNFNLKQNKLNSLTLTNLKELLSSFEFEKNIKIKCKDSKEVDCFVFIDEVLQEEKIEGLFQKCPIVYEYSKKQDLIEYSDLELENLESYPICFEFNLEKNGQSSQIIVDVEDNVFIFDNISLKPTKIRYINDIDIYFDNKINEVKDAF